MGKAPFDLPEGDRERLTRTEMHCMQWMMNVPSTLAYAKDDLAQRLTSVPAGKQRLNMLLGQACSLIRDISGTIPEKQRNHLVNLAKDMEVRIVPKMTPPKVSVVLSKADAVELVDAAQIKCSRCAEFNETSEKTCRLRKILEVAVPLENYSGLICPYSKAEWED